MLIRILFRFVDSDPQKLSNAGVVHIYFLNNNEFRVLIKTFHDHRRHLEGEQQLVLLEDAHARVVVPFFFLLA